MTTDTTTTVHRLTGLAQLVNDAVVVTKRNLISYMRRRDVLVFVIVQPVMFVLLFGYIFGGIIAIPGGGSYIDYALPGIMVQSATFAGIGTAVALTIDRGTGILDRFRSLPMSRTGFLFGRVFADTIRTATTVMVIFIVGVALGYRIQTDPFSALLAYLLIIAFGFTMSWLAVWVGLSVKDAEAAQAAGFVVLFPLTFISSAFVPPETLPTVLRWIAEINPLTNVIDSVRQLTLGIDAGDALVRSVIGMAVFIAVFGYLGVRKYTSLN
jgi:ABC-2 type transport system permease protein